MQTSPNMQGYEMSPKGKVTFAGILTNTHATPPIKNSIAEVTKYTWVFREESNLLKYDISIPGNITDVMGNHAHF